jgi:hypothetical protein
MPVRITNAPKRRNRLVGGNQAASDKYPPGGRSGGPLVRYARLVQGTHQACQKRLATPADFRGGRFRALVARFVRWSLNAREEQWLTRTPS